MTSGAEWSPKAHCLALASGGARSVVPLVHSVDSMGLSPPTSTPRCMAYAMTRTSRVIHARPHPTHLVARTSGAGLRLGDGRICSPGFDPLRVDLQGIRLDWTANTVGCVGLRGRQAQAEQSFLRSVADGVVMAATDEAGGRGRVVPTRPGNWAGAVEQC